MPGQLLFYLLKDLPILVFPKMFSRGNQWAVHWCPEGERVLGSRVWRCWLKRLRPRRPCAFTALSAQGVPRKEDPRPNLLSQGHLLLQNTPDIPEHAPPWRTTGFHSWACIPSLSQVFPWLDLTREAHGISVASPTHSPLVLSLS